MPVDMQSGGQANPIISVITACYNAEATLAATLDTILNQEGIALELIVIDGKSIDGTAQILERYANRITWFVSEPDTGIYDALNKGIKLATGQVIAILHADDCYEHTRVLFNVFKKLKETKAQTCYGDLLYVRRAAPSQIVRYWQSGSYKRSNFLSGWMPPHPAFFVRREVYEKYGLFNLEFLSASDYEFMLRVLYKYEVTTAYLPEVLVRMRLGGKSNQSVKNRLHANLEDGKAWRINGLEIPPLFKWLKPLRKIPQYFIRPKRYSHSS
jgi:glycosyltransferase involved in cell wall biosynthesis